MKTPVLLFIGLTAGLVSCGNSGSKGPQEGTKTMDPIDSDDLPETFFMFDDEQDGIEIDQELEYFLEQLLDKYEIEVNHIRERFFVDGRYVAPPGHQYLSEIHPAIELYERLHSWHAEMTPEQLARFRKLSKKIYEVF